MLYFNTYNGGSGHCSKTRKRLRKKKKRTDKEEAFLNQCIINVSGHCKVSRLQTQRYTAESVRYDVGYDSRDKNDRTGRPHSMAFLHRATFGDMGWKA